ncbi:hypothetical protein Tco_1294242 [Tanacetum coccineum]
MFRIDIIFIPMFDEYFTPPLIDVSLLQEAIALRAVVLADSHVSTSIDQDAPSSRSGSRFDTAYWGFLGVGTTFDIFQNIHILYLQYGVLTSSGYAVLSLFPLWSLVSAGTDTSYLP